MQKRFFIIRNAQAGRGSDRLLKAVIGHLEDAGAEVETAHAASVAEDTELASVAADEHRFDAIVAAGGDSTIRGVAAGLRGRQSPLGIIPAGTGNVMANEIGLGKSPAAITRTLLSGKRSKVTGGLANGRPFFLMAGVGFDADIVAGLGHELKKRIGKAAYCGPTLKALSTTGQPVLTVRIGERDFEAGWVIVTNARYYGGRFDLSPQSRLTDTGFHAVLFEDAGRMTRLRQLTALALGTLQNAPGVHILPCTQARITASRPVAAQIDGEPAGATPLDISLDDAPVAVLLPSSGAE